MSTWLYLQCEDHNPPLRSEDVGQHLYDLPDIRRHIARRGSYAEMEENGDPIRFAHHFGNHAYNFLTQHPRCTIRIVDEYGITHPTQEDDREWIDADEVAAIAENISAASHGFPPEYQGKLRTWAKRLRVLLAAADYSEGVGRADA